MKLYIKNMVCRRCVIAVEKLVANAGFQVQNISLGEVIISEDPDYVALEHLNQTLHHLGFELIDDRRSRLIEKVKSLIIHVVHHSDSPLELNVSEYLAQEMNYDYKYLSNLFSEVEGNTIENFFISQKIEKIKELLTYDELSLKEIAFKLSYSSPAYLSSQFKKHTGFTPGHFKAVKANKRIFVDNL
ncbi:helix-turn-helix domain-containing protein [Mucilaginibacter auburnensis]|uniref:AraC-like DNA-binding protein n=1 Tax=Mucilaginibacter auburnensis TaxID=1457233 RepID=A0A2H9VM34_9SPHI|nr:helix-turn-helix domain-containing protein [Mucilaginibacter auburnensis]PJJ79384.1 AraC-like DNA-binding protein [Mucilaginibacter auburnensis]